MRDCNLNLLQEKIYGNALCQGMTEVVKVVPYIDYINIFSAMLACAILQRLQSTVFKVIKSWSTYLSMRICVQASSSCRFSNKLMVAGVSRYDKVYTRISALSNHYRAGDRAIGSAFAFLFTRLALLLFFQLRFLVFHCPELQAPQVRLAVGLIMSPFSERLVFLLFQIKFDKHLLGYAVIEAEQLFSVCVLEAKRNHVCAFGAVSETNLQKSLYLVQCN